MEIFDAVFTLFMILFPAVFASCVPVRPGTNEQDERRRRLTQRLWLATALTLVAYLLVARWLQAVTYVMWCAFFPLWFWMAMPVLQLRDPGWGAVARGARRSASLVRRDVLPAGLRLGWIVLAVLWGVLFCVSLSGLFLAVARPAHWWLLGFNLAAGAELWLMHWAMHRSLIEPEPLANGESDELRAARARLHGLKLFGWLALAALTVFIFSLPPLLLIWYGNDALNWAIAIGAGGGTLAGIGGGVFGTIASIRRAQINRLCLGSEAHGG